MMMNPMAMAAMQGGIGASAPMPFQQPLHPQTPAALEKDVNWLKNNLTAFDQMSQEKQKTILGILMYKKVKELSPPANLIPKITGMLIDTEVLEIKEIVEILENKDTLRDRITEAISIIETDTN